MEERRERERRRERDGGEGSERRGERERDREREREEGRKKVVTASLMSHAATDRRALGDVYLGEKCMALEISFNLFHPHNDTARTASLMKNISTRPTSQIGRAQRLNSSHL